MAVMLKSGLDGVKNEIDPGEPVNKNVYVMSQRERARLKIDSAPKDLSDALRYLAKDEVVVTALGEHIYTHFLKAKKQSWQEYIATVHPWEVNPDYTMVVQLFLHHNLIGGSQVYGKILNDGYYDQSKTEEKGIRRRLGIAVRRQYWLRLKKRG